MRIEILRKKGCGPEGLAWGGIGADECREVFVEYDKVKSALANLTRQIEIGTFFDGHGHDAKMLKAYIDASGVLDGVRFRIRAAGCCGQRCAGVHARRGGPRRRRTPVW